MLHEALRQKFPSLDISESALPLDSDALKGLMLQLLRIDNPGEMRRLIADSKRR